MTELASQVKNIYDHYFDDYEQMSYELKQLNVGQNHRERLFLKKYNISSLKYIHKLRIEEGENLIRNTNMTVLNIAYTCGYGTTSQFNYYFKQHFGVTPKEYRKISNYCRA
ncbi:MAG TPA: helix-turn-helix transcriptional regulator [Syntrophomonadaceae bacterium]|nr:helix-turn-helix transcriptional regulator [Syntrophomonadaceae bacterium]